MALSNPELELLIELLDDDPGSDIFVTVGQEYVRREQWSEAVRVLFAGLKECPEEVGGWELLAEAAVQDGQHMRALSAIEKLPETALEQQHVARVRVLALAGNGEVELAREAAEAYLRDHADDDAIQAVVEHAEAEPQSGGNRATDPFVNTERAEQYVIIGRPDRAIRAYRRILFHNPGAPGLAARLRELVDEPVLAEDDLSEEIDIDQLPVDPDITETELAPPDLSMPEPAGPRGFYLREDEDVSDGLTDFEKPTVDEIPDFEMPTYGVSLAETVLPDDEITTLNFSREELQTVIEDQVFMEEKTDPGLTVPNEDAADEHTQPGMEAPAVELEDDDMAETQELRGLPLDMLKAGPAAEEPEVTDPEQTDPGVPDPAKDKVDVDEAPTNVVAKNTDLVQLAKKVKKVKRRRSLFRR